MTSTTGRPWRHAMPLTGVVALLLTLGGCGGGRFVDTHFADDGPVSPEAAALAQEFRLGPDGFGKIRLRMTMDEVQTTGQFVLAKGQGYPGCRVGNEVGATPGKGGVVWVSDVYGVVKISSYFGVRTPEGIGLGSSVDDVRAAYPGTRVETERDMGNGQIEIDDHYRSPVPGNPNAAYRFFVNHDDKVDSMLLVLANQDCDVGFTK
ncbi:hypothetical protein [Amycolatopsis taiwanensis]|nr:hypothetical protein [Amycolatopsis taiwanensis]